MGLIDKLKNAGEQAASGARQTVQETQLKHELADAYGELGRATFALIEREGLRDQRLGPAADRIRDLESQLVQTVGGPIK